MMRICSMASSSSGNCIYVGSSSTHILIDSGISGKRIKSGLEAIGIEPSDIDGIVITHEHSDHIKGLGVVSRKYRIPVFATEPAWKKIISSGLTGEIDRSLFNVIRPDCGFSINDLTVHPFATSHDAAQPVCYTFTNGEKKISVATDLGCYDSYITDKLEGSNVLFVEANHDIEMLKNGNYPYYLKKRILSDIGHLSNETSGKLISEVCHENLQYVILGHLSRENNHPEVAYRSVKSVLSASESKYAAEINLLVSAREEVSELITV